MSIILSLKAEKGKPVRSGRDHYWSLMMDAEMSDRAFTVDDIFDLSDNRSRCQIGFFIRALLRAEIISPTGEKNARGMEYYRVVARQSATPVFSASGKLIAEPMTVRQALWNAMRSPFFRSGFNLIDLVSYASTDTLRINPGTTRNYIWWLEHADYLVARRDVPGAATIWRLVRNTGPDAPKILRTECIYDPNRKAVIGAPKTVEVKP